MRSIWCLAIALAVAGCSKQENVFIDPALATMVPPDTTLIAGLRVDALKKTPIWQEHIAKQNVALFDRLRAETGLDPRNDVWELLAASDGKSTVVLARGKFAEHGLEPRLQREGFKRQSHKGYTILGDDRNGVAFLNSSTAAAGPLPAIHALIDGRDQGRGGIPKKLEAATSNVPRASQVWFASTGLPQAGRSQNLKNFEKGLEVTWGSADFSSGIDAQVIGEAATPEDAKKIHDALRALAGFARLSMRPEQKQMLRLLESTNITYNNRRVEVKLAAPADLIDSLFKLAPAR